MMRKARVWSSALPWIAILAGLAAGSNALSYESSSSKESASESPDDRIDPVTGHRVVRLSRIPGQSESFYFHQNAFTADGDKMVFANTGTNRARDFFVLDWRTRAIERLTDGGNNRGEIVAPRSRKVYYLRDDIIYSTHLDTHTTK